MTLDQLKAEAVRMMAVYRSEDSRRVRWAAVLASCLVAEELARLVPAGKG